MDEKPKDEEVNNGQHMQTLLLEIKNCFISCILSACLEGLLCKKGPLPTQTHTPPHAHTRAYNGLHLQHATVEDHLNTHTPAWVNCHHVLFLNNCQLRGREKKGRFRWIRIVWWRKMNTKRRREDERWFAKLPLASCGPLRHTGLVLARQIAFAGSVQWKQHDVGPGSGGITILSSHLVLCSL